MKVANGETVSRCERHARSVQIPAREFSNRVSRRKAAAGVAFDARSGDSRIVRVHDHRLSLDALLENSSLLVHEVFWITIVPHRDGSMQPGDTWHHVGSEQELRPFPDGGCVQHAGRVPVRFDEAKALADRPLRLVRSVDDAKPPARSEEPGKLGNERGVIARVRALRALESSFAGDELRARKTELERPSGAMRCEQTAGMIEMQVAQDDLVDVPFVEALRRERLEENVRLFHDAVALAELGCEECPDARLEERALSRLFDEQRSARELDASELVGHEPAAPERSRSVAEHGAAVETLPITEYRAREHRYRQEV